MDLFLTLATLFFKSKILCENFTHYHKVFQANLFNLCNGAVQEIACKNICVLYNQSSA